MFKDYYKILEVSPAATGLEIKKSYRRLALQFHPDKHFGNTAHEAKFKEIVEAYKILSDAKLRQDYNIKIKLNFSYEKKKTQTQVQTPSTILLQAVTFRKKIAVLDPERMNKKALYQRILQLLGNNNMQLLITYNDTTINKKIIREILFCCKHLPYEQIEKICFQLTKLAGTDNTMYKMLFDYSKAARKREIWDKYKLILAVAITIVLCIFIYFISENIY